MDKQEEIAEKIERIKSHLPAEHRESAPLVIMSQVIATMKEQGVGETEARDMVLDAMLATLEAD